MDIIRTEFSLGSVITDTTDRYGPIITRSVVSVVTSVIPVIVLMKKILIVAVWLHALRCSL